MGRGRYLKEAEKACSRKARFETAAAAEAFAEYRFRAYLCPVCRHYHLTSRNGRAMVPPADPPRKPESGAKLGDLDWSPVLSPTPPQPPKPLYQPVAKAISWPKVARCLSAVGKDRRARLAVEGAVIKSLPIADSRVREQIAEGVWVAWSRAEAGVEVLGVVPAPRG